MNDKIYSKSKRTKTNLRYMMKAKHIFKANFFLITKKNDNRLKSKRNANGCP